MPQLKWFHQPGTCEVNFWISVFRVFVDFNKSKFPVKLFTGGRKMQKPEKLFKIFEKNLHCTKKILTGARKNTKTLKINYPVATYNLL
jgi:hypothetical protein